MTGKEWDNEIEKLDESQRKEIMDALETLRGWETFRAEFSWTRIFHLVPMIKYSH